MIFKCLSNLENNPALWQFIESHPQGNVFQSKAFFKLHSSANKQKPLVYYVCTEGGEIEAAVCLVILSDYFWPISNLTTRAIIYGTPLLKHEDPELLNFLLNQLNHFLQNKAVYTQFRIDQEFIPSAVFERNGFQFVGHLNILINLAVDRDTVRRNISKNKRRNVTKSLNKGCQFREIEGKAEYMKSLSLIKDTYKRIKLPLAPDALFEAAYDILHADGIMKAFGMFENGKLLGVRLELIWKEKIYDWYAGSDINSKNRYPNDFLPYHILLWAKDQGIQVYDWGGAGNPEIPYGVREHKLKFGGDLINFGRYNRINNRLKYTLGKTGLKIYKLIR